MGNELLSSKIVIQEEDPAVRQIPGVQTAVPGFVGVCERGPFGPTLVTADTYRKLFGGYTTNGELIQALDGYFANGGNLAYVSRVVHYTDPSDATTKASAAATKMAQTGATGATPGVSTAANSGPYDLEPGQTLVFNIDGGADLTATFNATAASRDSADGGDPWPKTLVDGQTLTVAIDGGAVQTVTFHTANFVSIAAATAAEVAAVINGQLVGASATVTGGGQVRITSDKRGTGSGVDVTGGTANAALSYTTGLTSGTGNVANIDAVLASEVQSVVAAILVGATASVVGGKPTVTSSTTGGASSVLCKNTSTAVAVGFDNATHLGRSGAAVNTLKFEGKTDGTYGNALSCVVEAATSGDANRFNVRVVRSGVTLETWSNLSMDDTDANYCETVINAEETGSDLIKVTDQDAGGGSALTDRPANGTYTMTGGNDGLGGIVDADYIGGVGVAGRTGMRALDTVLELTLLAIPGRATSAVHNAMISYCEVTRGGSVFAVLDPPASTSASGMVTYVESTAAIKELSEFAAIYWPRIKVANPNTSVFGTAATITVAPSGYICGLMARNDSAREGGVYDAPAGVEKGILLGCLGFETDEVLDEAKRDLIYPKRINPICTARGRARYVDGSYTLKSTGNFPTVSERRGVIYIEQSVKDGIQFSRHRNNDETLRAEVARTVETFLVSEMKKGAFRTKDPSTAFFVDFGAGLNPPAVQFAGKLVGRIGLATQKPVQWAILKFSQDTRSLQTG